ncbi:MAG: hypothetical protein K8R36_25960 [Planctomycetales bacterium]|nr:hypothetical protein [Planctomycetales bacterium]
MPKKNRLISIDAKCFSDVTPPQEIPCPACDELISKDRWNCVEPTCPYCHEDLPTFSIPCSSDFDFDSDEFLGTDADSLMHSGALEKRRKAAEENDKALPIAAWMARKFRREGTLSQRNAVNEIREKFGEEFSYRNDNGNWAIAKSVLAIFKELTKNDAIYDKLLSRWRKRRSDDDPASRVAK